MKWNIQIYVSHVFNKCIMNVCVLFLEDDTVRERGPAQADDSIKTTGIDLFTYA